MAEKFSQLIDKMFGPASKRAQAKAEAMHAEMLLNELRQARGLSQKMLADVLHVQQPYIAKIEKRADIYTPPCAATSRQWAVSLRSSHGFPMAMSRSVTSRTSQALPLRDYRFELKATPAAT
jgi:transcriptional regulator with XRE-family HTH domain